MQAKIPDIGQSKSAVFTGILTLVLSIPFSALADSSDHIGPDPIQSENCVTITPGRSVNCTGDSLAAKSAMRPQVTINCGPGLFMLISHRLMPVDSATRRIRLISEDGEFSRQWLAISESQSGFLVFDGGRESDDYRWMVRLIGRLLTPADSAFGFSFDDESIEGVFELDYSDRKLIEQLTQHC